MADLIPPESLWGVPCQTSPQDWDASGDALRFYSASNPLQDFSLMRRLVQGGSVAFNALLKRLEQASPQQLLALCVLCQYNRPKQVEFWHAGEQAPQLFRKLREHTRPEFAPALAVWLDQGQDVEVARDLACLLARCGGTLAQEALARAYTAQTRMRRTPRLPPYRLPAQRQRDDANEWARAAPASGGNYALFTAGSLVSGRDLYVGLDVNSDGYFDQVWYTGLGNTWYTQYFPGGRQGLSQPRGPLKLAVADGTCTIAHHQPALEWMSITSGGWKYKVSEVTTAYYVTTAVQLSSLEQDSDGDGLPDGVEQALLLDPRQPDTDHDGLADNFDALPNLDQSRLDARALGVQRALVCALLWRSPDQDDAAQTPWEATYFSVEGAMQAAISLKPGGLGIAITSQEAMQRYQDTLQGSNGFSHIAITVRDLRGLKRRPPPPKGKYMAPRFDIGSPQYFVDDAAAPPHAQYVVHLDYANCGEAVWLVEINGELYPAAFDETWIS